MLADNRGFRPQNHWQSSGSEKRAKQRGGCPARKESPTVTVPSESIIGDVGDPPANKGPT